MKLFDKKYLKISLYVILTVFVIRILDFIITLIPMLSRNTFSFIGGALDLLIPVIIGLAIAYLLSGPVNYLEQLFHTKLRIKNKAICRTLGIILTYAVLVGIIAGIVIGIYFMIGGQVSNNTTISIIVKEISNYIKNGDLSESNITAQIEQLNIPFLGELESKITVLIEWLQDFIMSMVTGLMNFIISLGSNLFTFIISLVLSIYLLFSSEYFLSLWDKGFFIIFGKSRLGISIKRTLKIINYTFSNYIKGQLIEAFFVGVMCTGVLLVLDVDYAIVIGIMSGVLNLIPYIGAFVGSFVGAFMGFLTGGIWTAVWALICLIIVQQIDANILAPRIVGNKVGLHPAFILVAITIGGSQWGLLGMILSVPITASIISLVKVWYRNHFAEAFTKYKKTEEDLIIAPIEEPTAKKERLWEKLKAKARDAAMDDDIDEEIFKEDKKDSEENANK